jgi:UDP:flavonoid glycosyltransferase YjiC (YdhE family)
MRVLFSSTFGYGHVFPMLPLARAFADAGHDVLWATSADAVHLPSAAGIETAPAGLAGAALHDARSVVLSSAEDVAPPDRAAFVFPRMFGEALTPPMVADLLPLARDWRPDLLVHENGELASAVVGAVLDVPSITHAFGGAIPPVLLTEAGDRLAPVWAAHGQELPPYAGCFTSLYLDICPPSVQSVPTDHIGAAQPLRPVADTGPEPTSVPDYLEDDGRPLIYLTLGTVRNHSPVLRPAVEALAKLPVRVLVTVGPDGDPDTLGTQPENVRVERWVNQPQVLRHCAVVASHAGSGTFLGALALGLPQLCLPQAADQFRNAVGGGRSGAALVLLPPEATPEAIALAVSRLLAEDRFRRKAAAIAAEIARMPSPADVVDELVRRFDASAG